MAEDKHQVYLSLSLSLCPSSPPVSLPLSLPLKAGLISSQSNLRLLPLTSKACQPEHMKACLQRGPIAVRLENSESFHFYPPNIQRKRGRLEGRERPKRPRVSEYTLKNVLISWKYIQMYSPHRRLVLLAAHFTLCNDWLRRRKQYFISNIINQLGAWMKRIWEMKL